MNSCCEQAQQPAFALPARLTMYFILLFIYRSLHRICNFYEKQETVQSDAICTSSLTLCLWYQRLLISDMDRYPGQ